MGSVVLRTSTCVDRNGKPRSESTRPSMVPPRWSTTVSSAVSPARTSLPSLSPRTYAGWFAVTTTTPGGTSSTRKVPSAPVTKPGAARSAVIPAGIGASGMSGTLPGITPSSPPGTSGRGPCACAPKRASRKATVAPEIHVTAPS